MILYEMGAGIMKFFYNLKIFFKIPRKHLGERTTTIFIKTAPFKWFKLVYVEK